METLIIKIGLIIHMNLLSSARLAWKLYFFPQWTALLVLYILALSLRVKYLLKYWFAGIFHLYRWLMDRFLRVRLCDSHGSSLLWIRVDFISGDDQMRIIISRLLLFMKIISNEFRKGFRGSFFCTQSRFLTLQDPNFDLI